MIAPSTFAVAVESKPVSAAFAPGLHRIDELVEAVLAHYDELHQRPTPWLAREPGNPPADDRRLIRRRPR